MTQMDPQRESTRPYYEPNDFQMDYLAKFDPNVGVVDFRHKNLASKLSILTKSSSFINSNYDENRMNGLDLGKNSNILSSSLSRSYSGGSKTTSLFNGNLFNMNHWVQWKQWDKFLWNFVLIPYGKQILLQPLENIRTLMQISQVDDDLELKMPQNYSNPIQNDPTDKLVPEEEIDFFPIYTRMKHDSLSTQTNLETNSLMWENGYPLKNQVFGNDNKYENNKNDGLTNTNVVLRFNKLDTWEMFNVIKDNNLINWKYLWRSINYSFLQKTLSKISYTLLNKVIYQISLIWLPTQWINNSIRLSFIIKNLSQFITNLLLTPLDLVKLKQICLLNPMNEKFSWSNFFQFDKFDQNILISFFLQLNKILINNLLDFTLEFIIYYKLNLPTITNNQTIILTCLLRLVTQLIQLSIRLPLDTLIKRYQLQYLIMGNHTMGSIFYLPGNEMIIRRNNKLWSGLWYGWKINLMSRICQFSVNLMNQINDDIVLERF